MAEELRGENVRIRGAQLIEDDRPIEVDERDAHAELSGENASRVINESNKLNIQIHTDHYSNTSKQWQGHTKRKIVWKMAHWEVRAVILLDSETITWHIGYRRPRIESSGFMAFCWDVVVSCSSPAGVGVFIIHSQPFCTLSYRTTLSIGRCDVSGTPHGMAGQ